MRDHAGRRLPTPRRGEPPFPYDPDDIPKGLPGDGPIESELSLWLYIGKGLALLFAAGLLLTNAMYGLWELLALIAG
jgi:hypothetical protein